MLTLIFILWYGSLVAILVTIELIYWVYTGTSSITWVEHILSILASRLFLQIIIPCIFIDVVISVSRNVIDALNNRR